MPKMLKKLKKK